MLYSRMHRVSGVLSTLILLTATAVGVLAFLSPFLAPPARRGFTPAAHAEDAALVFVLLVMLSLGAVVVNLTLGQMKSHTVAVLGVLTAVGAALRLIPGPGGFSALFLVPILAGYACGPTFGFLLGTLTLGVSALITGGVGPWLPYQMFTTGWVGALAGVWGHVTARWCSSAGHPTRWEVGALAFWGAILGLLYGAIMNLWFWPFVSPVGQAELYWQPGTGVRETLVRYAAFYLTTSLWWDLGRAAGNAVLILALGRPILRALRRFQVRFAFSYSGGETGAGKVSG